MPRFGLTSLLVLVVGLYGAAPQALAEQFHDSPPYRIHYSAIYTAMLSPEVASAYGIQRANNRVLINVSVLRQEGDQWKAVPAVVNIRARDLIGSIHSPRVREVTEGAARYHLATMRVSHEDRLRFTVEVKTEDQAKTVSFDFEKTFYVD